MSSIRKGFPLASLVLALAFFISAAYPLAARPGSAHAGQARRAAGAGIDLGAAMALAPQLASAPAPKWVTPGLRLTYYTAAASTAGHGYDWQPDENGNWVNSKTGDRYSRGEKKSGGSGHGYTEMNVAAVDKDFAALEINSYTFANGSGSPMLLGRAAIVGAPGSASGMWVHPSVLKTLGNRNKGNTKILRGPYRIGDVTFDAVFLSAKSQDGSSLSVYDQDSGVLLHFGSSATSKGSPVLGPTEHSNTGGTLITQGTLVQTRAVKVPWLEDPMPAWVKDFRSLRFRGSLTMTMPGMPAPTLVATEDFEVEQRGPGWVVTNVDLSSHSPYGGAPASNRFQLMSGKGQLDGIWIPPAALGRLKVGQVLDKDPFSRVTVKVLNKSERMVVIGHAGPMQDFQFGYSTETGVLSSIRVIDRALNLDGRLTLASGP